MWPKSPARNIDQRPRHLAGRFPLASALAKNPSAHRDGADVGRIVERFDRIFLLQCHRPQFRFHGHRHVVQFTSIGTLLEWLFEKRKPRPVTYGLYTVLIVGTVLAADFFFNRSEGDFSWAGFGYGLLSAVDVCHLPLLERQSGAHLSPWQRSPLMVTGSCLLILCLFPPVYLTPKIWLPV